MKLKIKSFQETRNRGYCGPASLKIVFGYWGLNMSEKKLAGLCGVSRELGVSNEKMAAVARRLGFETAVKEKAGFRDIEKWLARGVPPIVDWFSPGRPDAPESEMADGHSSVVAGLDKTHIFLQDPELGRIRKIKRDDFLKAWFDFKGKYVKPNELVVRHLMAIYPKPS